MIAAFTSWSVTVTDIQELSRNNIKYQVKSCSGRYLARLRNKTSQRFMNTQKYICRSQLELKEKTTNFTKTRDNVTDQVAISCLHLIG